MIYLGIDPGKQGAFSFINGKGEIVEVVGTPLIGKEYDKAEIINLLKKYEVKKVGLENPSNFFGFSKSSATSVAHCVGMLEGMMSSLNIPYILTPPKQWQKEVWQHVKKQKKVGGKGYDAKATSTLACLNLFPNFNFKVTNRGNKSTKINDGFVDATLIAEYIRRMF